MGDLKLIFGLQVNQKSNGVLISQQKYILELLKKYKIENAKLIKTLISTSTELDKDKSSPSVN